MWVTASSVQWVHGAGAGGRDLQIWLLLFSRNQDGAAPNVKPSSPTNGWCQSTENSFVKFILLKWLYTDFWLGCPPPPAPPPPLETTLSLFTLRLMLSNKQIRLSECEVFQSRPVPVSRNWGKSMPTSHFDSEIERVVLWGQSVCVCVCVCVCTWVAVTQSRWVGGDVELGAVVSLPLSLRWVWGGGGGSQSNRCLNPWVYCHFKKQIKR